jgi:hypothetical protein
MPRLNICSKNRQLLIIENTNQKGWFSPAFLLRDKNEISICYNHASKFRRLENEKNWNRTHRTWFLLRSVCF